MEKTIKARLLALLLSVVMAIGLVAVAPIHVLAQELYEPNVIVIYGDGYVPYGTQDADEWDILTSTLSGPVGMQGFEGAYALSNNPNEIVEVIVQFVTPPTVALRLMQERGMPQQHGRSVQSGNFEAQALAAHDAFQDQMGRLPIPFGMERPEIFCQTHRVFNGVHMRVPAVMVEMIAELPEVYAVTPHILDDEPWNYEIDEHTPIDTFSGLSDSPFFINPNLERAARDLFEIDYIHSNLGITGNNVRVALLETGVDSTHPEFARFRDATGRIPGWQYYDNRDAGSHGTRAAGSVIAMAPEIELWVFRRITGTTARTGLTSIAALEAAHGRNMDVIYTFGARIHHPFTAHAAAVSLIVLDGTVVVVAAHNYGRYGSFTIANPLSPLAITVGAGTAGADIFWTGPDNIAPFSGLGPVELTYHIKPDIIAPGVNGLSTYLNGSYIHWSGTSRAGPVTTGLVALLVQAYPNASPQEIKAKLMNTARPLTGDLNSVFTVGAGFARPLEALTQNDGAFATVVHDVPLTANPLTPFAPAVMSSLSFGAVEGISSETLSITIHNPGSGTWIPQVNFNGSSPGVNLNITPAGAGNFNAQMTFTSGTPTGLYEGHLIFINGNRRITMPFAAMLREARDESLPISAEMALRAAVANAGLRPTVIYLAQNITLTQVQAPLHVPLGAQITLRSYGGTMRELRAGGNFDVITINSAASLTLDGIRVTRGSNTTGRGVTNGGGTLTMLSGEIVGNRVANDGGGGVRNASNSRFTMYGGTVANNSVTGTGNGGGVFNSTNVVFNMHGGDISNNTSQNNGGGVANGSSSAVFNMYGGDIRGNTSQGSGGGVTNSGNFIMEGGIIENNVANSNTTTAGGGVGSSGIFRMYGGAISGNRANGRGGGVGISSANKLAGNLFIGANTIFSGNQASAPRSRHANYDAIYATHILGTQWTEPFIQGINNYDISSGGTNLTFRTLNFTLNGTPSNPTYPASIAPIQVIQNTPIIQAPSFPSDPTRTGYNFRGWYLNAAFTQPLTSTSPMPSANASLHARWESQAFGLIITPSNHNFGAVHDGYSTGDITPQTFTITNTHPIVSDLTDLVVNISGPFDYTFYSIPGGTINPSDTVNFVNIIPQLGVAIGTHVGSITLTYDNDILANVQLVFQVIDPTIPNITIAPSGHDFGTVYYDYSASDTVPQTFTVINNGILDVDLALLTSVVSGPFDISVTNSIAQAGQTIDFATVVPQLGLGVNLHEGELRVMSNGEIHAEAQLFFEVVYESPEVYAVTIENIPAGAVSGQSGSGNYELGETVNLVAGTRTGYMITGWDSNDITITNADQANTSFVMPATNVFITANWEPISGIELYFAVTIINNPPGSITSQQGAGLHAADETVSLVSGTRIGYNFVNWTSAYVTITNENQAIASFIMPTGDVTVTANWSPIIITDPTFPLTVSGTGSGGTSPGTSQRTAGEVVSINAGTNAGYDFDSWTVSPTGAGSFADSSQASTTFTMPTPGQAVTITANWSQIPDDPDPDPIPDPEPTPTPTPTPPPTHNTFRLTLRAGTGGSVAIDGSSFGSTRTDYFEPGERISISARSDRDYDFDRWRYSHGEITSEFRSNTTFIMPNREVTIWADFYRDWRRDDDWWWRDRQPLPPIHPTPPAVVPNVPQPIIGTQQQNEPATDTANFTFSLPGVPSGMYPISITGLPIGITVPSLVQVFNNELNLQLTGISRAAVGTHSLMLTLNDHNGNALTVPIQFTLTTIGPSQGAMGQNQQNQLRLAVGNTLYTHNRQLLQSDAAPFMDQAYGRLMVPLRIVAEGLGAQVSWMPETNIVHISNNSVQLNLTVGEPLPGGMGTPVIIDGRTFVPVRYVAEMLGANVLWDDVNMAVYIRQ